MAWKKKIIHVHNNNSREKTVQKQYLGSVVVGRRK